VLSLAELRRVAEGLEEVLSGGRLRALAQTDACTVFLRWHVPSEPGGGVRHELVLSAHPESARISRVAERPPSPAEPPAFVSYLRAHLDRARFGGAWIVDDDRQLALRLETKAAPFDLLLSILGPRSNLYLIDGQGILRAALRPLAETRRDLAIGEPYRSPEGRPPGEGEDRFAGATGVALLDAIEAHYAPVERAARGRDEARRLGQAVDKELARLARRQEKLAREAQAGEEAVELHRQGELLKGALAKVEPGASEVVTEDFATGQQVTIPLDPKRSPKANLEWIFKRYHKALKRATVAGAQLAEAEERHAFLTSLREEIEAHAGDPVALAAIAARDDVKRLLARYAPPPPRTEPRRERAAGPGRSLPRRLLPKRYRASGGLEIWVGKNDEGNDHLTTRLARGKDLFLHLETQPGSHVILRTGGRDDPPQEALLEACELAVHFSKQRKANRANVHVVPIRNVKKPKGAKPGLVYVTGGKTVQLRRDPERLTRILDALIPEE